MKQGTENLKDRANQIDETIAQIKMKSDSSERVKKIKKISSELSSLKNEVETTLKDSSDANQKKQAESVQQQLLDSAKELTTLSQAVQKTDATSEVEQSPSGSGEATQSEQNQTPSQGSDREKTSEKSQELLSENKNPESQSKLAEEKEQKSEPLKEQNFFEKSKTFILDNVKAVFSKETRSKETGLNILRSAGIVGAGMTLVSGIKWGWNKLFGNDEETEKADTEEKETKEKKKKSGFWNSGFGKFLKWTGIGAGAGTAGYYLGKSFGRWGGEKNDPSAEATDTAEEQSQDTKTLKENSPEKFEKYQGLGANIDSQYNQIMKKELDAGWSGMSIADGYEKYAEKTKLSKEDFQATVPMCIDNEFSSVDNLLSEGGYYGYLREKNLADIKSFLIGKGEEWIAKVIGPYLTNLTSFIPFVGNKWSESLTKWLESGEPSEREAELKLFFRQYAKIVNYTQDKRARLMEKIAEEKLKTVGTEFSTIEDALDDEEWLENYVYSDDRYKNFMGGKLHQAIDVMKGQSLFDAQLSMSMKKQMELADAQRDELLNAKDGKDALQRLGEAGETLSPEINREGIQVCKDITEDLKENFDKDRSYLYFGSSHAVINSEQKNIQEFLKESGLGALKSGILESLRHFEQKFESGSMSVEDIQLYKNQINSYFAMKKEILIGAKAIQQMKENNASLGERALNVGSAIIGDLLYHSSQSLKSFKNGDWMTGWLQATLPLTLGGAVISQVGKWKGNKAVEKFGSFIAHSNPFSLVRKSKGQVLRRMPNKNLNFVPNWILSGRYNISHGDQLLFQDIIEGKIDGAKAQRLIIKSNSQWEHGKGLNSLSEFMQKVAGKAETELPAKQLQILFNNDAKISFTKNKSLRDLFFRLEDISTWDQTKSIWNGYRRKIYTPSRFHNVEILEKFIAGEAGKSSPFTKLTKNQQYLFRELVDKGKFSSIDELSAIIENIDKVDLENVELGKISRLATELSQSLSDFKDVSKLNNKVSDSVAKPLNHAVDSSGKTVDDAVDAATNILKKRPIFNDIGEQKRLLEADLESLNKLSTKSPVEQARLSKLEGQLTELENFEKQLTQGGEEMVNQTSELLTILKRGKNLNTAIEQLTLLKKLEGQKFASSLVDASGKSVETTLDDVIKNLDEVAIRSLKGKNISGVSDEAIEGFAKTLSEIKRAKNTKQFFSNADELAEGVKMLVKFFAKTT